MTVLKGKTILVTGATGSFGTAFIERVLADHDPRAVRAFSRDELKQSELERRLQDDRVRLLLGDVRDADRLTLATRGVDVIVHAAALKQVPACEYNPFEAVRTNVIGAQNVIGAALANGVSLTVALSTDKAVNPVNLYGATKLCAEKIVAQAGAYAGATPTRFASVRYGNVMGSRGSVVPVFIEQAGSGVLRVTDPRMTRFWITLPQAVDFVLSCLPLVEGGETFVPKIPSMRILEMASVIAPEAEIEVVGIRPGEKLHEVLLTEDEARQSWDLGDRFVIAPSSPVPSRPRGDALPDGYHYSSDRNHVWLTPDQLTEMLDEALPPERRRAGDLDPDAPRWRLPRRGTTTTGHRPLQVAYVDRNEKSLPYVRALAEAGHRVLGQGELPSSQLDLYLTDLDDPEHWVPLIEQARDAGARTVLYPHAAWPTLFYDSLWEPYEGIDLELVAGPGVVELGRRLEVDRRYAALGTGAVEQLPFRARSHVERVLFGPLHPSAAGYTAEEYLRQNGEAFERLRSGDWKLTVQLMGTPQENGIPELPDVEYLPSRGTPMPEHLDRADVIVTSSGTLGGLALARGLPLVVYAQLLPVYRGHPGEVPAPLRRSDRYADLVRYPIELGDDPVAALHRAASDEQAISTWRRRFVGRPLDPAALVARLERLADDDDPWPTLEARAHLTVAFVEELLEDRSLLDAYLARVDASADATLMLWHPGTPVEETYEAVGGMLGPRAEDPALPDVAVFDCDHLGDGTRMLAERAAVVLTRWPPFGPLAQVPHVPPEGFAAHAPRPG